MVKNVASSLLHPIVLTLPLCTACYQGYPDSARQPWAGELGGTSETSGGNETTRGSGFQEVTSGPDGGFETSEGADETSGFDEGTTGELFEGDPARDLEITRVTANQGVTVTLGVDGTVLGPREAVLIHGRRTLIQAHVRPGPTFTPREILGRLRLHLPDGTETVHETTLHVERETDPLQIDTSIHWVLEPANVVAGMRYDIELYETTTNGEPGEPPRFPQVGEDDLQISGSDQTLEVVFIPYRHVRGGCDRTAPHDAARIAQFREHALQILPIQDVQITVHDVVTYTEASGGLGFFLDHIEALRAQEAPAPSVYYHGSLYPCDTPDAGGLGSRPEYEDAGTLWMAPYRVSCGVFYDFAPEAELNTFVHEIGHNLSRRHVACAGIEGTVDPDYPHAGGRIGSAGWGVEDRQFRTPESAEHMGYCTTPGWQSDYGWNIAKSVLEQVEQLSDAAPPATWVLRIIETAEGQTRARIFPGHVPTAPTVEVRAIEHSGRTIALAGREEDLPDTADRVFTFNLPNAVLPELAHIEWSRGASRRRLAEDAIVGIAAARKEQALRAQ